MYDIAMIMQNLLQLVEKALFSDRHSWDSRSITSYFELLNSSSSSSSSNTTIDFRALIKSSTSNMLLSDFCELVPPAVKATLAVWRNAAGAPGVRDSQWDLALGAANKAAVALSSWLQRAGAVAEASEIAHPITGAEKPTAVAPTAAAAAAVGLAQRAMI
jgi:hypothetical protein